MKVTFYVTSEYGACILVTGRVLAECRSIDYHEGIVIEFADRSDGESVSKQMDLHDMVSECVEKQIQDECVRECVKKSVCERGGSV